MRILVTGGRGFLATNLTALASSQNCELLSFDGHLPSDEFAPFVRKNQPDAVVHLGGPSSVSRSFEDPLRDFHGTVMGTMNAIMGAIEGAPNARFLFVSSGAVYGNIQPVPISEDHVLEPISPYGCHKAAAEMLVRRAALDGYWALSARVFSAYGIGLRRQIVHDCFRRLKANEPLLFRGTGDEQRDFLYADDISRALLVLLELPSPPAQSVNIASGNGITIRDLVGRISYLFGGGDPQFSGIEDRGNPPYMVADTSKLRSFGFRPTVNLDDGLARVAQWLKESAK